MKFSDFICRDAIRTHLEADEKESVIRAMGKALVEAGKIDLDLPPGADRGELTTFQWDSARQDGVERVETDGTAFFTTAALAVLSPIAPDLAAPLSPDRLAERRALLFQRLGLR